MRCLYVAVSSSLQDNNKSKTLFSINMILVTQTCFLLLLSFTVKFIEISNEIIKKFDEFSLVTGKIKSQFYNSVYTWLVVFFNFLCFVFACSNFLYSYLYVRAQWFKFYSLLLIFPFRLSEPTIQVVKEWQIAFYSTQAHFIAISRWFYNAKCIIDDKIYDLDKAYDVDRKPLKKFLKYLLVKY